MRALVTKLSIQTLITCWQRLMFKLIPAELSKSAQEPGGERALAGDATEPKKGNYDLLKPDLFRAWQQRISERALLEKMVNFLAWRETPIGLSCPAPILRTTAKTGMRFRCS